MSIKCFFLEKTDKLITTELQNGTRSNHLYRRPDTGEEMLLADAPAGAMWFAPWYDDFEVPQLEHVFIVRCPDGFDWVVDAQASNCTKPHPTNADGSYTPPQQQDHHCWVIHGTPPNITVDKNGVTCAAGAGSIQTPNWHGFLRNGELVQ